MTEGLLRQRRNLFICVVLLCAMKFGEIRLTEVSLVGFDLKFGNPRAIPVAIWIAYGYFLYRYYLYFVAEGIAALRAALDEELNTYCAPRILRCAKQAHPNYNQSVLYNWTLLRQGNWTLRGEEVAGPPGSKAGVIEQFEMRIGPRALWKGIVAAMISFLLRRTEATDYILPFALAGFTLLYCGVPNWPGSLFYVFVP